MNSTGSRSPPNLRFGQELADYSVHLFVPSDTAMAVSDDSVAVNHKLGRPQVAEVVAKHFLFVVDDYGVFDTHPDYGFAEAFNTFFIVGSRRMHANYYETVFRILVVKIDDMRHGVYAWLAVESPEIDDYNLATQRLQRERF
jgi:hypothetical protein